MFELDGVFTDQIISWLLSSGLRILGILVIAFVVRRFGSVFVEKTVRRIITGDGLKSRDAEKKREDTLIQIINGTLNILVILLMVLMILQELGMAIGPILAAAGIAGLAFGFGGQYLIRDTIAGLFIILENQYRVGDVICLDGTCGLVEDISLRKASLRDLNGTVHHIPHGEVQKVSNMTKDYSRVNMDIGIAYESNLEQVIKVVNEVGNQLAEDEEWKDKIIKAPQFLRVDEFADSAIIIKILGDTEPTKQWEVAGEYRKRIKIAFDKAKIEIPFPQRVIHQYKK